MRGLVGGFGGLVQHVLVSPKKFAGSVAFSVPAVGAVLDQLSAVARRA
ncbi:hypothetical protein APY03_5317 [Variovorax sp. WDL1]|nr:hypothetical protein APY03_5317 [Variovorax sp. WDL1]